MQTRDNVAICLSHTETFTQSSFTPTSKAFIIFIRSFNTYNLRALHFKHILSQQIKDLQQRLILLA